MMIRRRKKTATMTLLVNKSHRIVAVMIRMAVTRITVTRITVVINMVVATVIITKTKTTSIYLLLHYFKKAKPMRYHQYEGCRPIVRIDVYRALSVELF